MSSLHAHLTKAYIHLDRLTRNMALIAAQAGSRPIFPAVKANAYGHDATLIGNHLVTLGYTTLCVAHLSEAARLIENGVGAQFIILAPTLPENSEYIVHYGCQPVVTTREQVSALALAARRRQTRVAIHLKVDTGMGRMGVTPQEVEGFLQFCSGFPEIEVIGVCSHFPCADEKDLSFARNQVNTLAQLKEQVVSFGIPLFHIANSAGIFALPEAHGDAVRPGIAIYGLRPSPAMQSPALDRLEPVMQLVSRITYIKDVEGGTGISYGHSYRTDKPATIATIPLGYGDGISRLLSGKLVVLVAGIRCPQVGRICMDQCMIDITAVRDKANLGDEVVIIGSQGDETITADELAANLGTINYEIVTAIAHRGPRIAVGG